MVALRQLAWQPRATTTEIIEEITEDDLPSYNIKRRAQGYLDCGVHYHIDRLGQVIEVRPDNVVASHDRRQDAIYILRSDTDSASKMTQKIRERLIEKYNLDVER